MPDVVTEESLRQLVISFYDRVRRHQRLSPIFEAHVEDWTAHIETLTRFWSSLMLTSGPYKGNPFSAHQKLAPELNDELFDEWLRLFGEAAEDMFPLDVSSLLRLKSEKIASSLRSGLLFRPQEPVRTSLAQTGGNCSVTYGVMR